MLGMRLMGLGPVNKRELVKSHCPGPNGPVQPDGRDKLVIPEEANGVMLMRFPL